MNIRDNEPLLPVLTKMYFDYFQITGKNPKVFKASKDVFDKVLEELVSLERYIDTATEVLPKTKSIHYRTSTISIDPNLDSHKIFIVE